MSIFHALSSFCRRLLTQLRTRMSRTPAIRRAPPLHYFRPSTDDPSHMTVFGLADACLADAKNARALAMTNIELCKELKEPQHEFLLVTVTGPEGFVGYATFERGRGKAVERAAAEPNSRSQTPSSPLSPPTQPATSDPDDSSALQLAPLSPPAESPNSAAPHNPPPPMELPEHRQSGIGPALHSSSSSLRHLSAADYAKLSRSRSAVLKGHKRHRTLESWQPPLPPRTAASPLGCPCAFSRVLAASSVTSENWPEYNLKAQCFHFAGVVFDLVTNGELRRASERKAASGAGLWHQIPITSLNDVVRASRDLRPAFERTVEEIERALEDSFTAPERERQQAIEEAQQQQRIKFEERLTAEQRAADKQLEERLAAERRAADKQRTELEERFAAERRAADERLAAERQAADQQRTELEKRLAAAAERQAADEQRFERLRAELERARVNGQAPPT